MKWVWRGDWFDWMLVQVMAVAFAVALCSFGVVIAVSNREKPPAGFYITWRQATPEEDLAWHLRQKQYH